jgi:hypothetical protein
MSANATALRGKVAVGFPATWSLWWLALLAFVVLLLLALLLVAATEKKKKKQKQTKSSSSSSTGVVSITTAMVVTATGPTGPAIFVLAPQAPAPPEDFPSQVAPQIVQTTTQVAAAAAAPLMGSLVFTSTNINAASSTNPNTDLNIYDLPGANGVVVKAWAVGVPGSLLEEDLTLSFQIPENVDLGHTAAAPTFEITFLTTDAQCGTTPIPTPTPTPTTTTQYAVNWQLMANYVVPGSVGGLNDPSAFTRQTAEVSNIQTAAPGQFNLYSVTFPVDPSVVPIRHNCLAALTWRRAPATTEGAEYPYRVYVSTVKMLYQIRAADDERSTVALQPPLASVTVPVRPGYWRNRPKPLGLRRRGRG